MELLTVASFLGAAIILTLAPGPDNLFVLAQRGKEKMPASILPWGFVQAYWSM